MTTTKDGTSLVEVLLLTSKSSGSGLVFPKVHPAHPALCRPQVKIHLLNSTSKAACTYRVAGSLMRPSRLLRHEKRSKRRVCAVSSRCGLFRRIRTGTAASTGAEAVMPPADARTRTLLLRQQGQPLPCVLVCHACGGGAGVLARKLQEAALGASLCSGMLRGNAA